MFNATRKNAELWTRRHLLKAASALTVGATFAKITAAEPDKPAKQDAPLIQIGIFLGTFGRPTLEARLDAVQAAGLDCVQLSMDNAGLADMPDKITPELAERIRHEAAGAGSRSPPCKAPST